MLHVLGYITVPVVSAKFRVFSDDGAYVTVNGTNIDNWVLQGCAAPARAYSPVMTFTTGQTVTLDAWMYEWTGSECFRLEWNITTGFPSNAWVTVPASAFSR